MLQYIKKWLNDQPIDECPDRWNLILKFVECINSTDKQTIEKGWEKTKLTEGMVFDDRIFEEPDHEEELLLQDAMEELMLLDDCENSDDIELVSEISAEDITALTLETQSDEQKKPKQKQITDFFKSQK